MEKQCTKCGEIKPLDEYRKRGAGRHMQCGECQRAMAAAWREQNRSKVRAYHRKYEEKIGRAVLRERQRVFREENRNTIRDNQRKYEERMREERASDPAKQAARSEYNRMSSRRFRVNNPRWHEEYYAKNVERYAAASQRRRNRVAGVESDGHTISELHAYWQARGIDPSICTYCSETWERWERSIGDHVLAIINGGSDLMDNLVPCCGPCNSSKNDRLLHVEWTPPNMRQAA